MLKYVESSALYRLRKSTKSEEAMPEAVPCCIISQLALKDKDFLLDGVVLSLTAITALFREATTFILDRRYARVVLQMGAEDIEATITRSTPEGYWLRFDQPLSEVLVDELVTRYRTDL